MSYRYYFDVSEVISAGYSPNDIVVRVDRDQALMYGEEYAAVISPITQYKDNVYYIEVSYPNGAAALPISEGRHQCETMLALVYPNYGSGWDASNDYSNQDIDVYKRQHNGRYYKPETFRYIFYCNTVFGNRFVSYRLSCSSSLSKDVEKV